MTSNYPPGIDDRTFGAPYNDEQFCLELTVKMVVPFTLAGPIAKVHEKDAIQEGVDSVIEQVREILESAEIEESEIINQNITKC